MSAEITNSNKKFEEALHLLNEAAKEKKDELRNIIGNKYTHIREVIQEVASDKMDDLNHLKKKAQQAIEQNPWPYIGGIAIGAVLLGYILGSSKR